MKFTPLVGLLGLVGATQIAGRKGRGVASIEALRVNPPIHDVTSDRKFYGPPFPADYPSDQRPVASPPTKHHPIYPELDTSGFLDHDFVTDENSDGGEWQAQMAYDRARIRLAKLEQQVTHTQGLEADQQRAADTARNTARQAHDAEAKAKSDLEQAKKNEDSAEAKETAAEKDLAAARAQAKKFEEAEKKREKSLKEHSNTKEGIEARLKQAKAAYDEQEKAFKECQEKFQKAKDALEAAQHAADEFKKKSGVDVDTNLTKPNVTAAEQRVREAKAVVKVSESKELASKAQRAAADESSKKADYEVEWRDSLHDKTAAELRTEIAEMEKERREMEEAKQKLRRIRYPDNASYPKGMFTPVAAAVAALFFANQA